MKDKMVRITKQGYERLEKIHENVQGCAAYTSCGVIVEYALSKLSESDFEPIKEFARSRDRLYKACKARRPEECKHMNDEQYLQHVLDNLYGGLKLSQ